MKFEVKKRDTEKGVDKLRSEGGVPCVCYGPDVAAISIEAQQGELISLVRTVGTSTIIDLSVDGEEHEVLLKEVVRDPVSEDILHVDFYAIKRGAEIELEVPLELVGESQAVKDGGVFNQVMYELPVRCRPRNLPAHIEIDISLLKEIGDSITVSDLTPGEGITFLSEAEDTIATVSEVVEEPEEEEGTEDELADVLADKNEEEGAEEGEEK